MEVLGVLCICVNAVVTCSNRLPLYICRSRLATWLHHKMVTFARLHLPEGLIAHTGVGAEAT